MILEESLWIKRNLEKIPGPKTVLDIGSSALQYRTVEQPYIDENVFHPLRKMGAEISHLDLKKREGVDIAADISSKTFCLEKKYDLVICASLLEHIQDLETAVLNISSTVSESGYLIVTAPHVYPYHPDPIDNLLRFTPKALKNLFKGFKIISAEVVYGNESISERTKRDIAFFRKALQMREYQALKYNIYCLLKKAKVSCCLFKNSSQ